MMGGFGGVWMIFMIPIGLIVLAIIGWIIWRGVNWGGNCCGNHSWQGHSASGKTETAMETLRRRYANGEITKDQFDQMKRDIS
jgi:putative membrane protein